MGPRPSGRGTPKTLKPADESIRLRQWGRGRVAAERGKPLAGGLWAPASMGPRPSGRGTRTSRTRISTYRGVNGAAAEWPRNDIRGNGIVSVRSASMGPRPSGRGTLDSHFRIWHEQSRVNGAAAEWPRNAAPATLKRPSGSRSVNGAAAEWPRNGLKEFINQKHLMRQWGRGRVAAERAQLRLPR